MKYLVSSLSINGKIPGNQHLGGLSKLWLTQKLSIFNQFPLIVKLGSERSPVGINSLAGWEGYVYPLASDSDVI